MTDARARTVASLATPAHLDGAWTVYQGLSWLLRERREGAEVLDAAGQELGAVSRTWLLRWLCRQVQEGSGTLATHGQRALREAVFATPPRCGPDETVEAVAWRLVQARAPLAQVVDGSARLGVVTLEELARVVAPVAAPGAVDAASLLELIVAST